jgi:MerR family transcriptional regulator, copper efflux regulator
MPKKYLNVNDVAQIFGVTPLTVRNWDKKGSLVAYRNPVNNYRMYKVEDVEALMRKIDHSKQQVTKLKIDIF